MLRAPPGNGHAPEVRACRFDAQARLRDIARDEAADRMPMIAGLFADGSHAAAQLARMAQDRATPAWPVFPPHSLGPRGGQRRPEMARAHAGCRAAASDLPLVLFHRSGELAYPLEPAVRICETVPSLAAIKDRSDPKRHQPNIRALHGRSRPVGILYTNSSRCLGSRVMGGHGILSGPGSGPGSAIADLQVALVETAQAGGTPARGTEPSRSGTGPRFSTVIPSGTCTS